MTFESSGKDQDFQLFYGLSDKDFGLSLVTYREAGKDGYFLMILSPKDKVLDSEIVEKDIVFVLDTSGSMADEGKMEKARKALWVVKGKRVAVLGLAFKANTDDIRFSPALEVVRRLLEEGAYVQASDPQALSRTKSLYPQVAYFEDPYEALRNADAALVCTEWDSFRNLDWERAGKLMARRLLIDGRNLYSPQRMRELGFEYYSFGRE